MTTRRYDKSERVELADEAVHWDLGSSVSYGEYLQLDKLLAAQKPLSSEHNEMLFILVHQVSELWMRLMLHELTAALECVRRDDLDPSLYDEVLRLLSRRGYGIPQDYLSRDFSEPYRASKQVAGAWLGVYHNAETGWDLYELAERLVDLDHNFQLWRCHHLKTVERII